MENNSGQYDILLLEYNPLTWMFYSKKYNNSINKLHERTLRLVCNDYESTFEDLLTKNGLFYCLSSQ